MDGKSPSEKAESTSPCVRGPITCAKRGSCLKFKRIELSEIRRPAGPLKSPVRARGESHHGP